MQGGTPRHRRILGPLGGQGLFQHGLGARAQGPGIQLHQQGWKQAHHR